jgi:hypothetical protein
LRAVRRPEEHGVQAPSATLWISAAGSDAR